MKSAAILQSCYIPWKGYFDLVNSVDEFILYDEVQYTRQDWRNRNRIKTETGSRWLTIPVTINGLYSQRLDDTKVADPAWTTRHWNTLRQSYRLAPWFSFYATEIQAAYAKCAKESRLSKVNRVLLEAICEILGIRTRLTWSTEYAATGGKTERLVNLCRHVGADVYVSGPRARDYLDESLFERSAWNCFTWITTAIQSMRSCTLHSSTTSPFWISFSMSVLPLLS